MNQPDGLSSQEVEFLIVEDSPTQAMLLQSILERNNYGVIVARNGREALEMLSRRKPTLVITDVNMPEMDGYELCRRIKRDEDLKALPVILLTSLSAPHDIVRGLECGADNFIVKPYEESFLLSRIHFILANQELRATACAEMSITVFFAGQRYSITSDRLQILNLLLSTYETAVQRNQELSKARELLEASAQELSRSNNELEQFAYVVSHDLQEPLRMVRSYLGLIEKRYKDRLDAEGLEFMNYAVGGAIRMQGLIQALLSYSRVGTHARPFEPTDLEEVFADVIANLQIAIEESQATVTHDPLPTLNGDESQLLQLFQNLIGNALKFRGAEAPVVHVSAVHQSDRWTFAVKDNGIGIDPRFADQVFVVFRRLHSVEQYPGTGIGLAVCKKIVERHGGRIWLESQPGAGATFHFTLVDAPA